MARMDYSSRGSVEYATLGNQPDALYELGLRYATGRDGDVDLIEAHKWFNLAALRGNDEARRYRNELSADMTKAEIALAQKRAREYMSKAH